MKNKGKSAAVAGSQEPNELIDKNELTDKLDTVRDILFGAQVRETQQKSQALEKLIESTADRLSKEFSQQIDKVEANIARLKESLAKQAQETALEISRKFKDVDDALSALDNKSISARNDLHEELSAETQALQTLTAGWNEDLAKQLEIVHQELQHTKTDRVSLATMFLGMAESLAPETQSANSKKK